MHDAATTLTYQDNFCVFAGN